MLIFWWARGTGRRVSQLYSYLQYSICFMVDDLFQYSVAVKSVAAVSVCTSVHPYQAFFWAAVSPYPCARVVSAAHISVVS